MLESYRLIWSVLTTAERYRLILLTVLTIIMSMFEVIGVAGIVPFLSVLNNPDLFETNALLVRFVNILNLESSQDATIALGLSVFGLVLVSLGTRAFVSYVQIRFGLMRAYSISSRLLLGYLGQDYAWYLSRHTSDLARSLLSEVDLVIRESMLPSILVLSNILTVIFIGGLLFLIEPSVAIGATAVLTCVYMVVFLIVRGKLGEIGDRRIKANKARFHTIHEMAGGLKEIKILGLEKKSMHRFRVPAMEMARNQTLGLVISRLPRFALEAAAYGGFILLVLMFVIARGEAVEELVPLLGLIGMSATKLFPALQQMFQQLSSLRFSKPALQRLADNLESAPILSISDTSEVIGLKKSIEFKDLVYKYPEAESDTLQGFTASIPVNATIGVVGGTGAGKTTLIDVLLGLLEPESGGIWVDGMRLSAQNIRSWQKKIGYVPQSIFLTDDSIAANIAFGTDKSSIDMKAVKRAAEIARLDEFIETDLTEGYLTNVGERGVRLSGGQRQRIGIARALYRDPDVLVFDEATSALDNVTERAVMEAVKGLSGQKTIVMIAHRLSTVRHCDSIFFMENGQLAAQGTYNELIASHKAFKEMAVG